MENNEFSVLREKSRQLSDAHILWRIGQSAVHLPSPKGSTSQNAQGWSQEKFFLGFFVVLSRKMCLDFCMIWFKHSILKGKNSSNYINNQIIMEFHA